MTPERLDLERLDEIIEQWERVTCQSERITDTLAALRAYRELLQAFGLKQRGLKQRAPAPQMAQETIAKP